MRVIHYHGTPITPQARLLELGGRNFCVSYAHPHQVRACHEIGQSVMLDNGAFSAWTKGRKTDWHGYYDWCAIWLEYHTTWAVIPDVIDGSEDDNDRLLQEWPHGQRGAPVWHLHESIDRLERLADEWGRVCFGSSGQYAQVGSQSWHRRVTEAFNRIGNKTWIHMLRGMALSGSHYPFSSVDSTDIARNHHLKGSIVKMADRWDRVQCPAIWNDHPEQAALI